MAQSSRSKGFLRPADQDFADSATWKEDKIDLDESKESAFIFNATPSLAIAAQRQRLPIAKNKNHLSLLPAVPLHSLRPSKADPLRLLPTSPSLMLWVSKLLYVLSLALCRHGNVRPL